MILLQSELEPLGVRLIFSVGEEEKRRLYRESHLLFSPSDNYQETFGLTVIEAMHYGCVPLVTDFDGYRDLVRDGINGFRIRTVAGSIPSRLFSAQTVISEGTYHGWWAAGVAFDPLEASRLIGRLADDDSLCVSMSKAARKSAAEFSISRCSSRIESLLDRNVGPADHQDRVQMAGPANPFVWDFTELFSSHPSEIWGKQRVAITGWGEEYLRAPYKINQIILLSGAVGIEDVRKFLFLLKRGHSIEECLRRGVEPVVASLALKNGLISLSD